MTLFHEGGQFITVTTTLKLAPDAILDTGHIKNNVITGASVIFTQIKIDNLSRTGSRS